MSANDARNDAAMRACAMSLEGATLKADLTLPAHAVGLVVFAHDSGSSRRSPRNRLVARHLNEHRLATLLFDLLSPSEAGVDLRTGALRFDIDLLSDRLVGAIDWVHDEPELQTLPIGLFGSSTGAGGAGSVGVLPRGVAPPRRDRVRAARAVEEGAERAAEGGARPADRSVKGLSGSSKRDTHRSHSRWA
jgi:hypothetical protein